LSQRVYQCENCGSILDRDYNAALNLQSLAQEKVGLVQAEFTPEDLTALLDDLGTNHLVTSKVETGIQQKSYL
ncbi:transposase, partial [Campylobacter coli]|nr:transposase [Campylobacter coli]EAK6331689.1 transposase [Campylobacter coli]